MAFNMFGTFTTGQWEIFRSFTAAQMVDLGRRKLWLQKALMSVGIFQTDYSDDGEPISFSAGPPNSHAAKLLEAYRILGGTPERDMLLRTSDKPVFLTRGLATSVENEQLTGGYSDVFSNGRRVRGNQRFDRDLGMSVERMKAWQLEAIKRKREHLEFKIKRALDYSDQLQQELDLVTKLTSPDGLGTVSDQMIKVEMLMNEPGAANVVQDSTDVHGLRIGKIADYTHKDALEKADGGRERG